MSKEIPILYSTPMVDAILELRKLMTRRLNGLDVVNALDSAFPTDWDYIRFWDGHAKFTETHNAINELYVKCPYGNVGDILYVRESHYQFGHWEKHYNVDKARYEWSFISMEREVLFSNDAPKVFKISRDKENPGIPAWYKRSSLFLEKECSRIWLEITNVRVERLHDITEADAFAEGILFYDDEVLGRRYKLYDYDLKDFGDPNVDYPGTSSAIESFKSLWIKINGRESWDANPWLWVIEFKVLSTTGKPIAFPPPTGAIATAADS